MIRILTQDILNMTRESGHYTFKLLNQSITIKRIDIRKTNGLVSLLSIVKKMLEERKQEFDKLE